MRKQFVFLSVCLSYSSGAVCVARPRTPTAAFESLGLKYVPLIFPHGQPEGGLSGCGTVTEWTRQ